MKSYSLKKIMLIYLGHCVKISSQDLTWPLCPADVGWCEVRVRYLHRLSPKQTNLSCCQHERQRARLHSVRFHKTQWPRETKLCLNSSLPGESGQQFANDSLNACPWTFECHFAGKVPYNVFLMIRKVANVQVTVWPGTGKAASHCFNRWCSNFEICLYCIIFVFRL